MYTRSRTEPRLRIFLRKAASCVEEHKVANSTKVNCKKCFGVDLMIIVVTGCVSSIQGCVFTGIIVYIPILLQDNIFTKYVSQ